MSAHILSEPFESPFLTLDYEVEFCAYAKQHALAAPPLFSQGACFSIGDLCMHGRSLDAGSERVERPDRID